MGGHYIGADPLYVDGKWIEISYGGPIKRSRDLWGSGATYGRMLMNGAPVWRAGADISTYLMTETTLVINGKTIAPGGYTMFIDLKPGQWTLIVSNWEPQKQFNPGDRTRLWGSFGYTPDKDVVRAPMTLTTLPFSMDQLTWTFTDMSDAGGRLAIMWDKVDGDRAVHGQECESAAVTRPKATPPRTRTNNGGHGRILKRIRVLRVVLGAFRGEAF